MTNPEREADDWWHQLPEETRESLNESARTSIIDGLVQYPYWDLALCAELLSWSQLESEVLEAHGEWLSKLKHRAESRGREWTRSEFLRQCRLTEAGE